MHLHTELIQRECKVWESRDYCSICGNIDPSFFTFPLQIGFFPTKKFMAVGFIQKMENILDVPPYTFRFLDTINDGRGIAFISSTPTDLDWHIKLEQWRPLITRKQEKLDALFVKRMNKIASKEKSFFVEKGIFLSEIWKELLYYVLKHKEYEIWKGYAQMKAEGAPLHIIYGFFLQFYQSILTKVILFDIKH